MRAKQCISFTAPLHTLYVSFIRFYLFIFRERGREGEREGNISMWLPDVYPLLGTWPTTQACALTGNWTCNPLVCNLPSIQWATPARWHLFFGPTYDLSWRMLHVHLRKMYILLLGRVLYMFLRFNCLYCFSGPLFPYWSFVCGSIHYGKEDIEIYNYYRVDH